MVGFFRLFLASSRNSSISSISAFRCLFTTPIFRATFATSESLACSSCLISSKCHGSKVKGDSVYQSESREFRTCNKFPSTYTSDRDCLEKIVRHNLTYLNCAMQAWRHQSRQLMVVSPISIRFPVIVYPSHNDCSNKRIQEELPACNKISP